jgi:transcriptional regulator with XRE-family HTH domain
MEAFGKNLSKRAADLGMSNAQAARLVGLSERRFGNYVEGRREPDLATLVRMAQGLKTTPDELLGVSGGAAKAKATKRTALVNRLIIATDRLSERDLELTVVQAEAVAALRR